MDDFKLQKCEEGIILLSNGLDITEEELIRLIDDGLFYKYSCNIPEHFIDFMGEMKATFDCY